MSQSSTRAAVVSCAVVAIAAIAFVGLQSQSPLIAAASTQPNGESSMAKVRVMQADGTLAAPESLPKFTLSDAEWKARLTPEQYRITRNAGTEPAFCGGLLKNTEKGMYVCVGCGLPLFDSTTKFESGTGWPSFYQPVVAENVATKVDNSYGMRRVEINCARCDGHLGHVFEDGPKPTGLRYCLNSESLRFVAEGDLKTLAGVDGNAATTQPAAAGR